MRIRTIKPEWLDDETPSFVVVEPAHDLIEPFDEIVARLGDLARLNEALDDVGEEPGAVIPVMRRYGYCSPGDVEPGRWDLGVHGAEATT